MAKATTPRKTTRTTKARTAKSRTTATKAKAAAKEAVDTAEDAVQDVQDTATEAVEKVEAVKEDVAEAVEAKVEDASDKLEDAKDIIDAEVVAEDTPASADSVDAQDGPKADEAPVDEAISVEPSEEQTAEAAPIAPVVKETIVERKAGFFPMLLGGVAAAVAGFGLSQYLGPNGWPFSNGTDFQTEVTSTLNEQGAQIGELSEQLAGVQGIGDRVDQVETGLSEFTDIQTQISDMIAKSDGIEATLGSVETQIGEIAERVTSIEKRPLEQAVSPETIAAYQAELDKLLASVDAERAELEAQRQEVADLAQRAVEAEQNALLEAELSDLKVATANVLDKINTGAGFADALEPLVASNIVSVPAALTDVAADGVPTQAELLDGFAPAARNALSVARASGADDEGRPSLTAFFTAQLGARSVQPREGDDPDAVLSRAEASVANGNLKTAFEELEVLPENAKAEMTDWMVAAKTRFDALDALQSINGELNKE